MGLGMKSTKMGILTLDNGRLISIKTMVSIGEGMVQGI